MYRFLLRPRWILTTLLVVAVVVTFVNLGFWQLRRLDERKAVNAQIRAAEAMPQAPIGDVVPAGTDAGAEDVDTVAYRSVAVTGTYRPGQQVLVRNRTFDGAPGYWVLTPMVQDDGSGVVVNRGWVPYSYKVDGPWTDFDPPSGSVTVTGMVRPPQVRATSGLVTGPEDPADGVLRALSRADVARLQQQVDQPLLPLFVDLRTQDPAQSGAASSPRVAPGTDTPASVQNAATALPIPVPEPELSDGPHLSYAGQWFLFTLLTLIVYPLMIRRRARRGNQDDPADDGLPGDDEVVDLSREDVFSGGSSDHERTGLERRPPGRGEPAFGVIAPNASPLES